MPLPILIALSLIQTPDQPQASPFSTPFEIFETKRIAATPKIDGRIEEEEWDPLGSAGSGTSMFQWEPYKLHFAAVVPEFSDLLASFDLKSDGWLIGKDNLQIRVATGSGTPVVSGQILDATRIAGPSWVDVPGLATSATAAMHTENGLTTIEVTVSDPGIGMFPNAVPAKLAMRLDAPPSASPDFAPFLPRTVTPISLVFQRSAALPNALKFNAEGAGKPVGPGEWFRMRLTFEGNNNMNLSQLTMRCEGLAKDGTNKMEVPFPKFDRKGRAFVDYQTSVSDSIPRGYRVMRAELSTTDGISSFLQTSFRVGAPLEFDLVPVNPKVSASDRSLTFAFYERSNTSKRLSGDVTIDVPLPLKVVNGETQKINLSGRQRGRSTFQLYIPAGTAGTFPIHFKGTLNNEPVEQIAYLTIGDV
jgi:hypothetical protein